MKSIKTLLCGCCGAYMQGRQWFNQDQGYGLCENCAIWIRDKESMLEIFNSYGIEGYHFLVKDKKWNPYPLLEKYC